MTTGPFDKDFELSDYPTVAALKKVFADPRAFPPIVVTATGIEIGAAAKLKQPFRREPQIVNEPDKEIEIQMINIPFPFVISKDGDSAYTAECDILGLCRRGSTSAEAYKNFQECFNTFIETCIATRTLKDVFEECGILSESGTPYNQVTGSDFTTFVYAQIPIGLLADSADA